MIIQTIDTSQSVEAILPYLVGLYPGIPISMQSMNVAGRELLTELTIEGKTPEEMTAIVNDLRVRFPLAF